MDSVYHTTDPTVTKQCKGRKIYLVLGGFSPSQLGRELGTAQRWWLGVCVSKAAHITVDQERKGQARAKGWAIYSSEARPTHTDLLPSVRSHALLLPQPPKVEPQKQMGAVGREAFQVHCNTPIAPGLPNDTESCFYQSLG